MGDIILSFLSGGVGVALVGGLFELLLWRKKRGAEKEDREAEKDEQLLVKIQEQLAELEKQISALTESQRYATYDRIRYLGQRYLDAGEIDFDDRRVFNQLHDSYHNKLGGNGDLDKLMEEVNNLRLKHHSEGGQHETTIQDRQG